MANILLATMGFSGHVSAAAPLVQQLVERGHRVSWYTGGKFRDRVEAAGARYEPMVAGRDFDDSRLYAEPAKEPAASGLNAMKAYIQRMFVDPIPGHLEDLERAARAEPPDLLLVDHVSAVAVPWHARTGIPWATFSVSPLSLPSADVAPDSLALLPLGGAIGRFRNRTLRWMMDAVLLRQLNTDTQTLLRRLGASGFTGGVFAATLSPFLYLQPTVPAFEYPRRDLPPQVHFTGPFLSGAPREFRPPPWWPELLATRQPVVHVTQGTLATDPRDLLLPAAAALAQEDLLVVLTTAGHPLPPLPANVRTAASIPHAELLPHVAAMVTNGGYGGVQHALAHGVPLVVAGDSEDKPEVANRVQWSGAGINLRTGRASADAIRRAVQSVLGATHYRERARRLQAQIRAADGPATAAALIEKLAATRQPVLREPIR